MNSWKDAVLSGLSSDGLVKVEGFRVDSVNYILRVGLCLKNTYVKLEIKDDGRGSNERSKYCKVIRYDKMECDDKDAFDFPDECKEVERFLRVFFISPSSIIESIKRGLSEFVDWKSDVFSNFDAFGIDAEVRIRKKEDWECNISLRFDFGNSQRLVVNVIMNVVDYWVRIKLNFVWIVSDAVFELTKALRIRYPLKQHELLEVIATIKALAKPYVVVPIRRQVSAVLADWCTAVLESLRKEWTIRIIVGDAYMEDGNTLFAPLVLNGGGFFVEGSLIHDVRVEFRIRKLSSMHYEYTVLRVSSYMKRVAFVPDSVDGVDMDKIISDMKLIVLDLVNCNIKKERKDFESRICAGLIRAGFWTFTDDETLGFFSDNKEGYFVDIDKNRYKIKYEDRSSFVYSFVLTSMDDLSTPRTCNNVVGARSFSESVVKYATEFRTSCAERKKRNDNPGYSSATMRILDKLTGYLVRFQRAWESSQSKGIKFDDEQLVPLREALNHLSDLITKRT